MAAGLIIDVLSLFPEMVEAPLAGSILGKAREKGLDAPDSLTDSEVWALIFAPGFSTAEEVTDVSGRGVGDAREQGDVPEGLDLVAA